MAIRILKIVLVVFVGLQGWLYVAGNIANWDSGLSAVGYVLGMEGHVTVTRILSTQQRRSQSWGLEWRWWSGSAGLS